MCDSFGKWMGLQRLRRASISRAKVTDQIRTLFQQAKEAQCGAGRLSASLLPCVHGLNRCVDEPREYRLTDAYFLDPKPGDLMGGHWRRRIRQFDIAKGNGCVFA